MTIRIGANPIGWSNDDLLEIGGETPLETCLAEAREAGFVGMELGNKFPREAKALKAALAPFGMSLVGGWHSVELLRRDAKEEFALAKAHRELLKAMDTSVFIVAETSNAIHGNRAMPLSQRPHLASSEWKPYAARMTDFAAMLADEGLALCYHHHMGTIIESREDIARFMDACGPSVNLLLDTGHATWGGSDPAELAATYRSRITHVHCKDVRPAIIAKSKAGDWSFLDSILGTGPELGTYTVPGDGAVDYVSVFKALAGYSGWVIVEAEQDPKKAHPLTYARKGVAHLQWALKEAGLA
ncbi:MAG: myo-inosose-2 dehydratase [Methylobacterium sp.]|nr:myo-inosose-2 dehydratase [Methylobacterium sp.]MCA3656220.1 myo-inosose-2 dehydratase [Methylobacterium sp.]MCA3656919.1 myo-inosose-2 dehydratase [Methylobacterium sp.]MCA3659775.1 myo-inosose-2 dehydratase [Methylobacterium sp.]MCA3664963.1 myo-inosose-2 dehydratase [Methylobacterium sp.]